MFRTLQARLAVDGWKNESQQNYHRGETYQVWIDYLPDCNFSTVDRGECSAVERRDQGCGGQGCVLRCISIDHFFNGDRTVVAMFPRLPIS